MTTDSERLEIESFLSVTSYPISHSYIYMSQKYSGAPPAYGSEAGSGSQSNMQSPAPAHVQPQSELNYYSASPQPGNGYPPPAQYPQANGYYAPGPQMGYAQQDPYGYGPGPQQGYGPGGYGPQGGYYGAPGMYGRPQGAYMNDPRGGNVGFAEALCASLACCCCLDACLLF